MAITGQQKRVLALGAMGAGMVLAAQMWRRRDPYEFAGRSVVITGGSRPNVVADRASARIDVRVQTMADAAFLESKIRGLRAANPAAGLEVAGAVARPPLERSADVRRLYERAVGIAAALGRDLSEGAAGGASDGNFTAALGVPTLDGLGPEGDGAHALHEHVLVDDLTWRGAFLAGLIESFG